MNMQARVPARTSDSLLSTCRHRDTETQRHRDTETETYHEHTAVGAPNEARLFGDREDLTGFLGGVCIDEQSAHATRFALGEVVDFIYCVPHLCVCVCMCVCV